MATDGEQLAADGDVTYASPAIGASADADAAAAVPAPRPDVAVVVHDGEPHELAPGEVLTFGRSALCTICLDVSDRGISRLAGSVQNESGAWWLWNRSSKRALTIVDELGIRSLVVPGRRIAIGGKLTVVVEGSVRRHALEVRADLSVVSVTGEAPQFEGDELPTAAAGEVLINALDRLALVSLFSGYLEPFPRYHPHPRSYADAAAMLGWPRTTLVKRIEHLRTRLTNAGFPNLVGEEALDHLAEWSLTTGVLTREDLQLIGR
ncbi:MAG TPA: hypothetical protein VGL49_08195 [Acidimicrobiales bacterium]